MRAAALRETVTIDLDTTDVEVYGSKKRGLPTMCRFGVPGPRPGGGWIVLCVTMGVGRRLFTLRCWPWRSCRCIHVMAGVATDQESTMNRRIGDHAVVLGAGMAGLLTAGVLAKAYGRVTVFDRDVMPEIGAHRRGVPQDRHLHFLHPRGRQTLDKLFPGLIARLIGQGAATGDALGNIRWQLSGYQLRQADIRLPGLLASRPFLEGHVRARVSDVPNVTFVERTDVVAVTATTDRCRVTGVRVHDTAGGGERAVPADLVIDATGRGSRVPLWLSELGYERAAVDRVDIGLGYTSRIYRLRPGALGTDVAMVDRGNTAEPARRRDQRDRGGSSHSDDLRYPG